MSALVAKLLMLASTVLVALPPGWCCATPKPNFDDQSAPPHSCCPQEEQQPTPVDQQAPTQPVKQCCCEMEFVNSSEPDRSFTDLAFPVPVVVTDTLAVHFPEIVNLNVAYHFWSPPLHLLECVWRC